MNEKSLLFNRSIVIKLDDCVLRFVFLGDKERNFQHTSFDHLHSTFELHFVIAGSCKFSAEGVCRTVSAGGVVVIPPQLPHFFTDYSPDCKKVDIRVSKLSDDDAGAGHLPFNMESATLLENMTKITCYADDFYEALGMRGRNGEIITRSAITLLYFRLLKELGCNNDAESSKSKPASVSYDYAIVEDFLMQSYMKNIGLKDVADRVGFSPTHIGRVIKKIYGMSYSKLILKLRMEHAKKLILEGLSPADIYDTVCYSSYNGFALAFKRYHSMSPEKMRKERTEINILHKETQQ